MEMTRPFDEVDVSTIGFWELSAEERDARLAVLRENRPVSWQRPAAGMGSLPGLEGTGYWAVLRHADVMTVSRDPETYSSAQGYMIEEIPMEILENAGSFLAMDHPRHTQMRRLVSQAFSPRRVRLLEEKIAARAEALVGDLLEQGEGDFVKTVAMPLPSLTYAEMVGVEEEDRERIVALADNMVAYNDPDALEGRDGLTLLMEANDTTRNSISHGMRALGQFPEQRALLESDLEARLPNAVEEIIRWATPVMTFRRTATRDAVLNGVTIAEGEKVVMFYNSANRDESVFPDPWRFDITREAQHVGFGGGGPHFCLGASLARSMLRSTFRELINRAPTLELGEPKLLIGNFIHGITAMPYKV
jgi:cytochrome P450